jgi:hypothetical protein
VRWGDAFYLSAELVVASPTTAAGLIIRVKEHKDALEQEKRVAVDQPETRMVRWSEVSEVTAAMSSCHRVLHIVVERRRDM